MKYEYVNKRIQDPKRCTAFKAQYVLKGFVSSVGLKYKYHASGPFVEFQIVPTRVVIQQKANYSTNIQIICLLVPYSTLDFLALLPVEFFIILVSCPVYTTTP